MLSVNWAAGQRLQSPDECLTARRGARAQSTCFAPEVATGKNIVALQQKGTCQMGRSCFSDILSVVALILGCESDDQFPKLQNLIATGRLVKPIDGAI